ncbi:MAG: Stp1/IreP family PP2C-type Ser/Thr phosphatase [Clostridium sp.]|nr:Stp1/IreP family PP2C-type Ser/Thr phosphatase [Clostridium sp.]
MVGIKSDVGNVRELNEDYAEFIENDKFKIYLVADGMGGHNAGEIASKLAVKSIIRYLLEHSEDDENILLNAVKYANNEIYEISQKNDKCKGMGTTITGCFIKGDIIQVVNVGDSCCFSIKDKEIKKVTKDHSWVQELIDAGAITEEEGRVHPKKNIITRALGTKSSVQVDIFSIDNNKSSMFLLCSDGLSNEVQKEEILEIVNKYKNVDVACERLVDLAKTKGGKDNITVLLFGGEV